MRIGFICPYSFDEPGGVQAHILDLAQYYLKQGHFVQVLGPCSPETEAPDFLVKGGSSVPIKYNGSVARISFSPNIIRRVRNFIDEGQFDVLHIHEPNVPGFALAALMNCDGPLVATYHVSAKDSKILKAFRPIIKPYLERIRGGIAVSELARRWQVEQWGTDPVLIPNGVDIEFFAAHRKNDSDKGSAKKESINISFLGRVDEPRKGLNILLDALPLIKKHVDIPIHLTVIGGGEHRDVPDVNFVGRVSDEEKARILAESDIYVAPNTGGESFGIVLVEAMAAGAAVIASDLEAFGAVCGVDTDKPAGLLFKNGDSEALAQAIIELIQNEEYRKILISNGHERSALYDWKKVANDVMCVYQAVQDGTKVSWSSLTIS